MPTKRLKDYLDERGVKYVLISHSRAFTAQEIAASAHVPGREMAKTVVIKINGEMALAVLPASSRVDLDFLKYVTNSRMVELAEEKEFKDVFPGCELGAMPPFGNLYRMRTLVADSLAEEKSIVFNAGSHTELMRMSFEDFERAVRPEIIEMTAYA
ncbi:MAG: deacylase [Acidobacteria bacterium]|nr:deacylase [Acidobacteriota bacterium]NIM63878.1 deacylase [Acidobacteriota bacterium]NIO60147.1 deacylase [Acidobacteriota bacterium]NIQ31211.1 deacylase [Acidobacteriota bacterium]NIQ86348.1 deacylase [Acidobacteriota bacterium]